MASIKDSVDKIYTGETALVNNIFFFLIAMVIATAFFFFGVKSIVTALVIFGIAFFFWGFMLKLMHGVINQNSTEFPEFDLDIIITAFKAIPMSFLGSLICFLISLVLSLIPILGSIAASILTTLIMDLIMLQYCENFNLKDSFNFKKIKFLLKPLLLPIVLLSLKMSLIMICVLAPIIALFTFVLGVKIFDYAFIYAAIFTYMLIITQIIYFDNLAQIYTEITFDLVPEQYS